MYVKECSRKMNVDESLLIDAVARLKREQKEARLKNEAHTNNDEEQKPKAETHKDIIEGNVQSGEMPLTATEKAERQLIQMIILYGEREVGNVETENGTVSMNVIEYINYETNLDGLSFSNPIYRNILDEALEHSHEENFSAHKYFLYHPNSNISQLTAKIESEKYYLSRGQNVNDDSIENRISEIIPQMIIAYKLACVERILNELLSKLANPEIANNEELSAELMQKYNDMKKVECALAIQAGDRVILS